MVSPSCAIFASAASTSLELALSRPLVGSSAIAPSLVQYRRKHVRQRTEEEHDWIGDEFNANVDTTSRADQHLFSKKSNS